MKPDFLLGLITALNGIIDSGATITLNKAKEELAAGRVVDFLDSSFPDFLPIVGLKKLGVAREISNALRETAIAFSGRERKKLLIEKNGYGLILALVAELLLVQLHGK